jgi:hypothetical protein
MLLGVYNNTFMDVQARFLEHGHVVEVNAAGSTMIFTDEPEIFKATMSSKVCATPLLDWYYTK